MKKFLLILTTILLITPILTRVSAADNCKAPYYIPSSCPEAYIPGTRAGYTADLNCANNRIINPKIDCCPNMCVNIDGTPNTKGTLVSQVTQFEVFNTTFRVSTDSIPTLINLLISTILGIFSLYTLIRGMFVAGYKRSQATSAEDIANINKDLTNMVIGFALAWGFIILIQIVASALGVGQLSNMDLTSSSTGTVITIK